MTLSFRQNDCAPMTTWSRLVFAVAFLNWVWLAPSVRSDWPSILGPTRNGIADASCNLPDSFSGLPKQIWKVEAGQGYAGPAIAGNNVILFDRVKDIDRVRMLDARTGKEIWRRDLSAKYRDGVDPDKGPRSVPSIQAESVLVYSAAGDLTLLSRKDGAILWARSLRNEYEGDDGYFGAGSTPLVVENRVIVNAGGKSACVVCVGLSDGKTLWTASKGDASYASPILLAADASSPETKAVVVVPARLATLGLDLETGNELWKIPFGQRGPTVNAATPIVTSEGDIFLTASYGIGSLTIRPSQSSAEIVRKAFEISSQYASPVAMGGKIFGSDGREDQGGGTYKCIREDDGNLVWMQPDMPISHTIGVGQKILISGVDGQLWCLHSSATKFAPLWKTNLPKGVFRAIPALSENRFIARTSSGNGDAWYCFQL